MNLPSVTTLFGVLVSIAAVYIFFKGLLCVAFDISQHFVNRLTDTKSEISEASSTAKTVLFWCAVFFLGLLTWKLIERFALEGVFFKATGVAAGLCLLGLAVVFVRWFRVRATERAAEKNFRGQGKKGEPFLPPKNGSPDVQPSLPLIR